MGTTLGEFEGLKVGVLVGTNVGLEGIILGVALGGDEGI